MKIRILALAALLCAVSCGPRQGARKEAAVPFPDLKIPSVITDPGQRSEYVAMHFWDNLQDLAPGGEAAEKAVGTFFALLEDGSVPLEKGQAAVKRLFTRIEQVEEADTSRHVFTLMTQLVSRYLYDPNSPLRNEDLYLPFVSALASSRFTPEEMRYAYRYEAESCSINQYMTVAPDFAVATLGGRTFNLHSVNAGYILLFFSNPGCNACRDIIEQVSSCEAAVRGIEDGSISVVNVYIDEDLKAWREYEHNYPRSWKTGYDLHHIIRGERLYDVRAIPSLYLLDSEKRIIMKDAPVEKVLAYISNSK